MNTDIESYYYLSRSPNFYLKSEESDGHWIKNTRVSAILLRHLLEHVPNFAWRTEKNQKNMQSVWPDSGPILKLGTPK